MRLLTDPGDVRRRLQLKPQRRLSKPMPVSVRRRALCKRLFVLIRAHFSFGRDPILQVTSMVTAAHLKSIVRSSCDQVAPAAIIGGVRSRLFALVFALRRLLSFVGYFRCPRHLGTSFGCTNSELATAH